MDTAQYAASTVDFWVLNAGGLESDADGPEKRKRELRAACRDRPNVEVLRDKTDSGTQAFGRIPAREPVTKRMQLSVIGAKCRLNV
jgi:hypothetical protein